MTEHSRWRPIASEESDLIRAVVTSAGIPNSDALLTDLDGALVSNEARWILDVKTSNLAAAAQLPDGPFPARAFVPNEADYEGEIIIWLSDGHVSGLEFAWVTDEPPSRWPRPDEVEVRTSAAT